MLIEPFRLLIATGAAPAERTVCFSSRSLDHITSIASAMLAPGSKQVLHIINEKGSVVRVVDSLGITDTPDFI